MKKILLLFAICTVCGCVDTPHVKETVYVDSVAGNVKEVEVKGHIYLIYDSYHAGNIIHAEHCPCRKQ